MLFDWLDAERTFLSACCVPGTLLDVSTSLISYWQLLRPLLKKMQPDHLVIAVFLFAFCFWQPTATHCNLKFSCLLGPRVLNLQAPQPSTALCLIRSPLPCKIVCGFHFCNPWILLARPSEALKLNGACDGWCRKGSKKIVLHPYQVPGRKECEQWVK